MVNLTIDGKQVSVPKGTLLIEACKGLGVEIPHFCYHPKMDPVGVCRMCLVQVEKMPKPQPACATQVGEGMVVNTNNAQVAEWRKGVLEMTLVNHPLDCPVCDKGGECQLQDLTFEHGPGNTNLVDPKLHKPKAVDLGQFIVLDEERCILCRRCVRFDNEIACENNLVINSRGHFNLITTASGESYDSYFGGNTIELCPVGALTSDLYRFQARPWDLSRTDSVCTGCSVGCNTTLDFRHGELLRVISRDNPEVDGGWICDRGRFNYKFHADGSRLTQPLLRKDGNLVPVTWAEAFQAAAEKLGAIKSKHGGKAVGIIGGGRLTNEEAFALQKLGRQVLGTPNLDHRVGGQVMVSTAFGGRQVDVTKANVILVVDSLPAETAPVMDLRIRRAIERNRAKLVTVGAALPNYRGRQGRVAVKPGESAGVIAAVAAVVAGEKKVPAAAVDAKTIQEIAAVFTGANKVVIVWGGEDAATGAALHKLATALKVPARKEKDPSGNEKVIPGRSAAIMIPGAQNNSRGAEIMGMLPNFGPGFNKAPEAGLDTHGMLKAAAEGSLKGLYLVGANLLGTYPDKKLAQAALQEADVVIVQDLFLTETAAMADIVFPAAAFAEKSGSYTNIDGLVQSVRAPKKPEGATQPDLLLIDALGAALGKPVLKSNRELAAELKAAGVDLAPGAILPGAPEALLAGAPSVATAAGEGLVLVPVDRLYAGGGTARFDKGLTAHVKVEPAAFLNPADAAKLGVKDGDVVTVQSGGDYIETTARLNKKVNPGTVQAVKGLSSAPVNLLGAGCRVTVAKRALEGVAD